MSDFIAGFIDFHVPLFCFVFLVMLGPPTGG